MITGQYLEYINLQYPGESIHWKKVRLGQCKTLGYPCGTTRHNRSSKDKWASGWIRQVSEGENSQKRRRRVSGPDSGITLRSRSTHTVQQKENRLLSTFLSLHGAVRGGIIWGDRIKISQFNITLYACEAPNLAEDLCSPTYFLLSPHNPTRNPLYHTHNIEELNIQT